MPAPDVLGRSIPVLEDSTDLRQLFARYSLSSTGLVRVGSLSEAKALLAQINNAVPGGQPRPPVEVWRTDVHARYLHPNTGMAGEGWEYMGGRQNAADLRFTTTTDISAGGSPGTVPISSIARQTPGWTISGNNVVIPATGLYDVDVTVNVDGAAGSLGRVFAQVRTTNGVVFKRVAGSYNENNYQGSTVVALSQGNQLYLQVFHEAGGSRAYTASMLLYMKADPRWTSN